MAFLGLCGSVRLRPCKLAWATSFAPYYVGSYPSEYLPARTTIWYASCMLIGSLQQPLLGAGQSFGLVGVSGSILGGLTGGGIFGDIQQTTYYTTSSWYTMIWAVTDLNINQEYKITADDLKPENMLEGKYIKIKLNNYLFDVLCVIDDPKPLADQVAELRNRYFDPKTKTKIESDDEWKRSQQDQFDHAVMTIDVPSDKNRFHRIARNDLGLEYRLDNKRGEVTQIANYSQNILNPTYNDASSKEMWIDISIPYTDPVTRQPRAIKKDDILYITYLGVKPGNHIMRQHVYIKWNGFAQSFAPAIPMSYTMQISHYRFFTWDLEKVNPKDTSEIKRQVSGWRVVETFWAQTNQINAIGNRLGDFIRGGQDSSNAHQSLDVMPGNITYPELVNFVQSDTPNTKKIYGDFTQPTEGARYHTNIIGAEATAADWFKRMYQEPNYTKFIAHTVYNVHPKALRKRDLDKWGMPRFMADEIAKDIAAGKPTFCPFMDDPYNDDPLNKLGHVDPDTKQVVDKYLDATNFLIRPIQRVSQYGGNAEASGSGLGSISIGMPTADNWAVTQLFTSNLITEPMPKGTKILIERFFSTGTPGATARGPEILSIVAFKGGAIEGVSAILDPVRSLIFVFYSRAGMLAYHELVTGYIIQGLSSLQYHPEVTMKSDASRSPIISNYEYEVGYGGLLGDTPGFSDGRLVHSSFRGDPDTFSYLTTDINNSIFKSQPANKITRVVYSFQPDNGYGKKLVISLPLKYHGITVLKYTLKKELDTSEAHVLILFKNGDAITLGIDTLTLSNGPIGKEHILHVRHQWVEADKMEIIGKGIQYMEDKVHIDIQDLHDERSKDFLDGRNRSDAPLSTEVPVKRTSYPVLFATTVMSVAEDARSILYVFFNDSRQGISVAITRDFGEIWTYQYGIVEKMSDNAVLYPFVITNSKTNKCFLFFMMRNKIFCKPIDFNLFRPEDEMRVVSYEADILQREASGTTTEATGWYTDAGRDLRAHAPCYLAAGSIFDDEFVEMVNPETKQVELQQLDGGKEYDVRLVKKYPLEIGSTTCFVYKDVDDAYFSAYRRDQGELLLFFLGKIANGKSRLQCHFSTNDGEDWVDLFEYSTHRFSRCKIDIRPAINNGQTKSVAFANIFIDRENKYQQQAKGQGPSSSEESYIYGLNMHKQGDNNDEEEDISSPYVFFQQTRGAVFCFYVYRNCLFCKQFQDDIFSKSYDKIKDDIENKKSDFIDGWLKNTDLITNKKLRATFNFPWENRRCQPSTNSNVETQTDGKSHTAVDTFDDTRAIEAHRVSACELPDGMVKVFYKSKNGRLKSATFKDPFWVIDDLLRRPKNTGFFTPTPYDQYDYGGSVYV